MKKFIIGIMVLMSISTSLAQSNNGTDIQREFMYFVYSDLDRMANKPSEKQQSHIVKIGSYIDSLAKRGKLRNAQPFEMEGIRISGIKSDLKTSNFIVNKKVIAGYYHILASDMAEAIEIAKADPRFEDEGWEIAIRPVKLIEGINNK